MSAPFNCYSYDEWKIFIESANTDLKIKDDGLKYLSKCKDKNLPFILSFKQLPYIWSIDVRKLANIVTFPKYYYREFTIPKRSGGQRKIATPYPALYDIQEWILRNILDKASINSCAMGFCHGKSNLNHAKTHSGNKGLLKSDIVNFFPSITLKRVITVFKFLGYPSRIASSLGRFCCLNGVLPQGSATSPALSNIICNKMDYRLIMVAEKYSLVYSRYADDIAFSGEYIPISFLNVIEKIINDEGFELNMKKTYICNGHGKKVLTGISISNGKLALPREKKRILRVEAFKAINCDPMEYIYKQHDPIYYERLIGKYSYWKLIEPSNYFVVNTISALKKKQEELLI
jgi:RNA-directed DNA polymerase